MSEFVVVSPVFLDLTFVGLECLPELGEERFAAELLRTPGGGAITAIGAARLGVESAVASPIGDDVGGELVREALAAEGVACIATRHAPRTPTTVVMPFGGDRAMVTVDPGARTQLADVAAHAPTAVAANLDLLYAVPDGAHAYVTCGGDDARAYAGRPPATLEGARALFVSRTEALELTGCGSVDDAARTLAQLAETAVVTLAGDGAVAVANGELIRVPAERVGHPVDSTGAGDLFVAAYVWADLRGAALEERLRWATLYAGLAVRKPTGIGGALHEAELLAEGASRELPPPPRAGA